MAGTGGKRPNAGRKPNAVGVLRKSEALKMLDVAGERNQWHRFLNSKDENVALKAFLAWNERAYGKAPQAITGHDGGPIEVAVHHYAGAYKNPLE